MEASSGAQLGPSGEVWGERASSEVFLNSNVFFKSGGIRGERRLPHLNPGTENGAPNGECGVNSVSTFATAKDTRRGYEESRSFLIKECSGVQVSSCPSDSGSFDLDCCFFGHCLLFGTAAAAAAAAFWTSPRDGQLSV